MFLLRTGEEVIETNKRHDGLREVSRRDETR